MCAYVCAHVCVCLTVQMCLRVFVHVSVCTCLCLSVLHKRVYGGEHIGLWILVCAICLHTLCVTECVCMYLFVHICAVCTPVCVWMLV